MDTTSTSRRTSTRGKTGARGRTSTRRTTRTLAALALVVPALSGLTAPAGAASPRQVDPALMQPTLNPDFAPWSCVETGGGITCRGSYTPSYHEQMDFTCDGRPVWIAGTAREQLTRWHTPDGLATRTMVQANYPADVFSLHEDGSGPTLTVRGHWQRHYTYAVPGDRSTRTLTEIGAIYQATVPGQGNVLHDVGRVTFAPGAEFETITETKGIHEFYDDFGFFVDVVCAQLLGS